MGAEASSLAEGLPDGLLHAVAARAAQDQTHLSHLSGRERDEAARSLVRKKFLSARTEQREIAGFAVRVLGRAPHRLRNTAMYVPNG